MFDALRALSPGWQMFVAFLAIQAVSFVFSSNAVASLQILLSTEMSQTAVFFVACYVFLSPGRAEPWAAVPYPAKSYTGLRQRSRMGWRPA
jgi:hypothetical protein